MMKNNLLFLLGWLIANAAWAENLFSWAPHSNLSTQNTAPIVASTPSPIELDLTQEVLLNALKWIGVRYQLGGTTENGLDCSGFVRLVFQESLGKDLPRTAHAMSQIGQKIEPDSILPGDLVFFNTLSRPFSHVGIYLGDHYFLHAPRAGSRVRLENMNTPYWKKRMNGIRRIF